MDDFMGRVTPSGKYRQKMQKKLKEAIFLPDRATKILNKAIFNKTIKRAESNDS
jgi:hypothetical protein